MRLLGVFVVQLLSCLTICWAGATSGQTATIHAPIARSPSIHQFTFAPFGPAAGDTIYIHPPSGKAPHSPLIPFTANILGQRRSGAVVSSEGWIAFGGGRPIRLGPLPHARPFETSWSRVNSDGFAIGDGAPSIAGVWGALDIDGSPPMNPSIQRTNSLYFRLTTGAVLMKLVASVGDTLPPGFLPSIALIVTWFEVRAFPATASFAQHHNVTAQVLIFVRENVNCVPYCDTETVVVWRMKGDSPESATFGAGLDNGVESSGAVCHLSADKVDFDNADCDTITLPYFAMSDGIRRLSHTHMVTSWGAHLPQGEFAFKVDRDAKYVPRQRDDPLPPDPSVHHLATTAKAIPSFIGFGPSAGDNVLPAYIEHVPVGDVRFNIRGRSQNHPMVSRNGYLTFGTWENIGSIPHYPPFRTSSIDAQATFAAMWGNLGSPVHTVFGAAPRFGSVYFRTASVHESQMIGSHVPSSLISNVSACLIVTWYRMFSPKQGGDSDLNSTDYGSAQLVIMTNSSNAFGDREDHLSSEWSSTVAGWFFAESGSAFSAATGAGFSSGAASTIHVCYLRADDGMRLYSSRGEICDDFIFPAFNDVDMPFALQKVRQVGMLNFLSGMFIYPVHLPVGSSPVSATPASDTPAPAPTAAPKSSGPCAWAINSWSPSSMNGHLAVTVVGSTVEWPITVLKNLSCLTSAAIVEVLYSELRQTPEGKYRVVGIRVSGCAWPSMPSCTSINAGRLQMYASQPVSLPATFAGVVSKKWVLYTPSPVTNIDVVPITPLPTSHYNCTAADAAPPVSATGMPALRLLLENREPHAFTKTLAVILCLDFFATLTLEVFHSRGTSASGSRIWDAEYSVSGCRVGDGAVTEVECVARNLGRLKHFATIPENKHSSYFVGIVNATWIAKREGHWNPPLNCSNLPRPLNVEEPRLSIVLDRPLSSTIVSTITGMMCLSNLSYQLGFSTVAHHHCMVKLDRCSGDNACVSVAAALMREFALAASWTGSLRVAGVVSAAFFVDASHTHSPTELASSTNDIPTPDVSGSGSETSVLIGVTVGFGCVMVTSLFAGCIFVYLQWQNTRFRKTTGREREDGTEPNNRFQKSGMPHPEDFLPEGDPVQSRTALYLVDAGVMTSYQLPERNREVNDGSHTSLDPGQRE